MPLVEVERQHDAHALKDVNPHRLHLDPLKHLAIVAKVVGIILPIPREAGERLLVSVLEEDCDGKIIEFPGSPSRASQHGSVLVFSQYLQHIKLCRRSGSPSPVLLDDLLEELHAWHRRAQRFELLCQHWILAPVHSIKVHLLGIRIGGFCGPGSW